MSLKPFKTVARMASELQAKQQVSAILRHLLTQYVHDELALAGLIADGKGKWRGEILRELRGIVRGNEASLDGLIESSWRFLNASFERRNPNLDLSAGTLLDAVVPPPSAPTQKEIDEAWTLDIASSDEAMREHYEGSARTRTGSDLGLKGGGKMGGEGLS